MRTVLMLTLGIAILTHSAAGQERPRIFGRTLDFRLVDSTALRGELLAAGRDSIWVLPLEGSAHVIPLRWIAGARVSQSGITAKTMLIWAVVGGLISGGALTGACSTVEDASCGAVLPVTLGAWLLVGGLAAAVTGSGTRSLPPDAAALSPYARFPQGLPPSYPLADSRPPPHNR